MTTTLFTGGRIHTLAQPADWLLTDDSGTIVATGDAHDRPGPSDADRVIDLDGAIAIPGFCDGHVHLPATGLQASGMDLRGETRKAPIVAAFAERAGEAGMLYGGNFEDPLDEPIDRHDLDRAVGDRPAMLTRADMHSTIVSSALLEHLDVADMQGVDVDEKGAPTGYLRERAAAEAWRWFEEHLPRAEKITSIRSAVRLAYSKGIAHVNEMFVLEWRSWSSLDILREAIQDVSLGVDTWVATDDVDRVVAMGYPRVGGDYFLDGSFGSHTAWMSQPFTSPPPDGVPACGISYRSDDELRDFFRRAQSAGLQAAVHAIGDAAIEQAISVWESVASEVGGDAVRSLGHRIEHFECATGDHIARAAALGLKASVQPAFDLFWGGREGLYAERIGSERAWGMNRFRSMIEAGLVVGAGSDSTVTPLDPFLQMAALRTHHREDERLGPLEALRAHTYSARALGRKETPGGSLEVGRAADIALLDRDPLAVEADELREVEVLGTWIGGRRVWPEAEAEAM